MDIQLGEMQSIDQEEEAGVLGEEGEKEFWVAKKSRVTWAVTLFCPAVSGPVRGEFTPTFIFLFSVFSPRNDLFWGFLVQYMLGVFSVLL